MKSRRLNKGPQTFALKDCPGCPGNVRLKVPVGKRRVCVGPNSYVMVEDHGQFKLAWSNAPKIDYGVLTGAKEEYWPTLAVMVLACREENVPLAVADHGLISEQVERLKNWNVTVLPLGCPTSINAARSNSRTPSAPEAWLKPRTCLASPFLHTIWIDADAVPVRGLRQLFDLPTPWLTRDWWTGMETTHGRYGKLLTALGKKVPDSRTLHVNSGVFGFKYLDNWILSWAEVCDTILDSFQLLKLCGPRDQSALTVVLAEGNGPPLLDDAALNYPANGLSSQRMSERKRYPDDPEQFLADVRQDHPDAKVVHWLGRAKPWRWGCKLPEGRFTEDWTARLETWRPIVVELIDKPVSILEVGAFEGRGTRWLLENLCAHPDAKVTCVDVWRQPEIEARWDSNLAGVTKVTKRKGLSGEVLRQLKGQFDLIYIDGSHWGRYVIEDAVLSWPLLKPDGLLIFDDYNGGVKNDNKLHVAVTAFLRLYGNEYNLVRQDDQVIVRKKPGF